MNYGHKDPRLAFIHYGLFTNQSEKTESEQSVTLHHGEGHFDANCSAGLGTYM